MRNGFRSLLPAAALALAACSGPDSAGQAPDDEAPNDVAGLTRFADEFDRAQLQKDRAALERMVADDLVFITGDGERLGKQAFIDGWTAPGDQFDPVVLADRVVRPLGGDAGVVTARTLLSGTSSGSAFASRIVFTDTFERVGGQWRAVHIQVTRIPDE